MKTKNCKTGPQRAHHFLFLSFFWKNESKFKKMEQTYKIQITSIKRCFKMKRLWAAALGISPPPPPSGGTHEAVNYLIFCNPLVMYSW
jgi:hypothetical protein